MLEATTAPESKRSSVYRSRCELQWRSPLLPTHPTHVPKSPSLCASCCHICAGLGVTTQGQYSRSQGKGCMQQVENHVNFQQMVIQKKIEISTGT